MRRKFAIVFTALVAACAGLSEWQAPPEARAVKSPLAPGAEVLAAGAGVYAAKCLGCHGPEGRGNGTVLRADRFPHGDLTAGGRVAAASDGELYWKISTGRRPMPAFASRLSESERWQVVAYVRSLSAK